jgi:ubiquinone/menaquinone biosynthesis C-methylase UbiE
VTSSSRFYDGWLYAMTIDRLLAGLRHVLATRVPDRGRVLDACCGTGALAVHLAGEGRTVVGMDMSPRHIAFARRAARSAGFPEESLRFEVGDVARLEVAPEERYDLAIVVLALHEMEPHIRLQVVTALARSARRVMLVDFNTPMPRNVQGLMNRMTEALAGIHHFRAFQDFTRRGGLSSLVAEAQLVVEKDEEIGSGTLRIVNATLA